MHDVERQLLVVVSLSIHAEFLPALNLRGEHRGLAEDYDSPFSKTHRDPLRPSRGRYLFLRFSVDVHGRVSQFKKSRASFRTFEGLSGECRYRIDSLRFISPTRDQVVAQKPVLARI